jgi:sulfonate transport system substrate-binding protein
MLAGAAAATAFGRSASAQQPIAATMAYGSTGYTWSVPMVAEGMGAWQRLGVDLKAIDFPTGRDSMQALLAGSADFSASTDTPLVLAALQGLRPIVLVNYSRYTRDMKIVVRKGGPIDPDIPASLKGKTIATRIGTSGQFMLAKYLEMAGLSMNDIKMLDMSPDDMTVSLMRGEIDGFSWTAQAANVAERQSNGKCTPMVQDGLERFFQSHELLLTTERVLKEKPDLARTAASAMFASEDFMTGHPEWLDIVAKRTLATAAEVKEATSVYDFTIRFDDRFLTDLVGQAEWAIASGLARAPKQDLTALFRGLIDTGPVKAIRPDRVTLA